MSERDAPDPLVANRLSTDDVPEAERLDYWQYVCSELVGGIELSDYAAKDFFSRYDLTQVGDIKFSVFKGVSQTLHRKPSLIRSTDSDDFVVVLESEKILWLDQAGHQRSGHDGLTFVDLGQPFFSRHPQSLDVVDVIIPRKALERVFGPARLAAGLSISSTQPSFALLSNFLRALSQHGPTLDPVSAKRMSSIAIDLIAAAFAERIEHKTPRTFSGAALVCRAQAYISERIDVAGLNMQEVAAALKVSVRSLHQAAAEQSISLTDWMWERRLLRGRSMLSDPVHDALTIAAIAYQCGFTDQAHFSRRFKARFGQSPAEFRNYVSL